MSRELTRRQNNESTLIDAERMRAQISQTGASKERREGGQGGQKQGWEVHTSSGLDRQQGGQLR